MDKSAGKTKVLRALLLLLAAAIAVWIWVRKKGRRRRREGDIRGRREERPAEQIREREWQHLPHESEGRLPFAEWPTIAKCALRAGLDDGVTRLAASQTYYALMSLFPALIVVVALLALIGQQSTTRALIDLVAELGPGSAAEAVRGPIEHVIASRGTSKTLLSISLLVSVFSASAFVGSFMWTTNKVYEVEGRPFLRKLPRQILLSLALMVALALIAVLVVLTGPVAATIGEAVGLGEQTVFAYAMLRWPLLFIMASLLFSLLYHLAPNVQQEKLRWITPGGVIGVTIWLFATVAFTFYVNTFSSYEATYGTLAGIVVFLFWLWVFNLSLLFGLEIDVSLGQRRRELAGGGLGDELPE